MPAVPFQKPWTPEGQNAVIGFGPEKVVTFAAVQYVDVRPWANFLITFGAANMTSLNLLNPADGQRILLRLKQDSVGSRLVSAWTDIFFPGGTEPTLTTGANLIDAFELVYLASLGKWYARTYGLDMKA